MSNDRVRRRIQANSTAVADGLEHLQDDLLELFNSQLAKYQETMLARDEETRAMVVSLVRELGAVKEGIAGLSVQLAEIIADGT